MSVNSAARYSTRRVIPMSDHASKIEAQLRMAEDDEDEEEADDE